MTPGTPFDCSCCGGFTWGAPRASQTQETTQDTEDGEMSLYRRDATGAERKRGTVVHYNARGGFGFISAEDGRDYFVHTTNLDRACQHVLRIGERVEFELAPTGHRGPAAVMVRLCA